jgi:hypothetical protein
MGRTLSLVGVVMFTVGVFALSSLARRSTPQLARVPDKSPLLPERFERRVIPVFAFDSPFSLN